MITTEILMEAESLHRAYQIENNRGLSWGDRAFDQARKSLYDYLTEHKLDIFFVEKLSHMTDNLYKDGLTTKEIALVYPEKLYNYAVYLEKNGESSMATEFCSMANAAGW